MGDLLGYDAARLRILVERHLLHTGSARAREMLDNWDAGAWQVRQGHAQGLPPALTDMAAERAAAKPSRPNRLQVRS